MKIDVTTLDAEKAGTLDLSDAIFGLEPRSDILNRMVRYQLNKRRVGSHSTQGRSDVTGTRKKMYRQKGTGGARHGDKKVPQFRGGAKAFGPKQRDHATDLPKKVRALALMHALSAKAKSDALVILDKAEASAPKTGELRKQLSQLGLDSALIVDGSDVEKNFGMAARNIPCVDVLPIQGLNVYDILRRDKLVLTRAAVEALEERFRSRSAG